MTDTSRDKLLALADYLDRASAAVYIAMESAAADSLSPKLKEAAAALRLAAQGPSPSGDDEAEFWCRLLGKAVDALDELSSDDSDFESVNETRQDAATRLVAKIRAQYKDRPLTTPTPSDNGVHAGMKNKEIKQHISWLYQYMRCMKQENWLDMRDSAERQLERLEAMLSAVPEGKI